jgi:hypothetical protein
MPAIKYTLYVLFSDLLRSIQMEEQVECKEHPNQD